MNAPQTIRLGDAMTIRVSDPTPTEPVDYSSTHTPPNYVCKLCGHGGIKLWRESDTFGVEETLRCADCAASERGININFMRPEGIRVQRDGPTDRLGDLVPAVLAEENGRSYWAYYRIPADGGAWWQGLPLR